MVCIPSTTTIHALNVVTLNLITLKSPVKPHIHQQWTLTLHAYGRMFRNSYEKSCFVFPCWKVIQAGRETFLLIISFRLFSALLIRVGFLTNVNFYQDKMKLALNSPTLFNCAIISKGRWLLQLVYASKIYAKLQCKYIVGFASSCVMFHFICYNLKRLWNTVIFKTRKILSENSYDKISRPDFV